MSTMLPMLEQFAPIPPRTTDGNTNGAHACSSASGVSLKSLSSVISARA
jgi:hypothetical protein